MNSVSLGTATSELEVTNISSHGIWLFDGETCSEHFLPYKEFPWFETATISQIRNVQRQGRTVLHWPDLDVDLDFERIRHPERFPLTNRKG